MEKNKECASLKSMFDEETHRHKVALTNHKMELLKLQGTLERERDSLVNKVQELQSELDLARTSTDRHQRELEEAERESLIRVQQVREEEWKHSIITSQRRIMTHRPNLYLKVTHRSKNMTMISNPAKIHRNVIKSYISRHRHVIIIEDFYIYYSHRSIFYATCQRSVPNICDFIA
uniref:Uncharacterized protein n=1 Tax=Ciona savignyi TaxID=51511 RepID=H2YT50_CIOSA